MLGEHIRHVGEVSETAAGHVRLHVGQRFLYSVQTCRKPVPTLSNVNSSDFRARICKCSRSPEIDSETSIPPAYVAGGPVGQIGLSYRPIRLGIDSWAPKKVYKYGLWKRIDLKMAGLDAIRNISSILHRLDACSIIIVSEAKY